MTATIKWFRAAKWENLDETERQKTFEELKKYCYMDTLAMVEIYRRLVALKEFGSPSNAS